MQCGFAGEASNKWTFYQGNLCWRCLGRWYGAFQSRFTSLQYSCFWFLLVCWGGLVCLWAPDGFAAMEKKGCMGTDSSLLCLVLFHIHEKTFLQLQLCFQYSRRYSLHKNCWSYVFRLTHHWVWPLGRAWFLYLSMLYHVSQKHSCSL